jgi:hypothetical protein
MSTGVLDSLQNPLSRVNVLRDGVNLVKSPLDGTTTWGSLRQYYINDLVTSSINGGAYVMSGGLSGSTCVRGGDDPSIYTVDVSGGVWTSLSQVGPSNFALFNSTSAPAPTVTAGGAGVYTVANASLTNLAPDSVWLVSWQGTATSAGVSVAADVATWTFTPSGAGALPASVTVLPRVDAGSTSWSFSVSAIVVCGAGTPSIVVTGAYAGTIQAISNVSVAYERLR